MYYNVHYTCSCAVKSKQPGFSCMAASEPNDFIHRVAALHTKCFDRLELIDRRRDTDSEGQNNRF